MSTRNNWYVARAASGVKAAEIDIYGEIGAFGVDASQFINDFRALGNPSDVTININSIGGEVVAALAIYNFLMRSDPKITVRIDGIAASAASMIAMAGEHVVMPSNTMMMIHDPSGLVMGGAEDMRDVAEVLDKMKASLVSCYVAKTGMEPSEIETLLTDETWMTAGEAVDMGFADEMIDPVRMAAVVDLSRYRNVPAALAALTEPGGSPASLEEIKMSDKTAPEAGAEAMPAVVTPDLAEVSATARADALGEFRARAAEITDLCKLAGVTARASDYIAGDKSMPDIRAELINARAEAGGDEISGQHADEGVRRPVDILASWAKAYEPVRPTNGVALGRRM